MLHDIDLQVRRGETVALLGANGAGKSTLMRALAGLHRPVRGGIHFEGRDLVPLAAERIVGIGVILVPEGRQVFAGAVGASTTCGSAHFCKPADIGRARRSGARALSAPARTPCSSAPDCCPAASSRCSRSGAG